MPPQRLRMPRGSEHLAAPIGVAGRYELLAWVDTPPADLIWTYDPVAVGLASAVKADVAEEIGLLIEERRRRGQPLRLEDNPLFRVLGYDVSDGRLVLRLGRTSYFHSIATRARHAEWLRLHGPPALANGMGTCGPTVTADGLILLAPRGAAVASNPGLIDVVPAGHAHPPEHPLDAMPREGVEELGITPEEIVDFRCLGLIRNPRIVKLDIIASLRVSVTWDTLSRRHRADAWETGEFVTLPESPSAVTAWLAGHLDDMSPAGHASLLLHGRARWGDGWFADTLLRLGASQVPDPPL